VAPPAAARAAEAPADRVRGVQDNRARVQAVEAAPGQAAPGRVVPGQVAPVQAVAVWPVAEAAEDRAMPARAPAEQRELQG